MQLNIAKIIADGSDEEVEDENTVTANSKGEIYNMFQVTYIEE